MRLLKGRRVLVVEDEFFLADDLVRCLAAAGAEVLGPVASVADAEKKVRQGGFQMAVVDMNLRGDLTCGIAERLTDSGIPFVLATGYDESSLPEELREVPRVAKPYSGDEVVKLLAGLAAAPSST